MHLLMILLHFLNLNEASAQFNPVSDFAYRHCPPADLPSPGPTTDSDQSPPPDSSSSMPAQDGRQKFARAQEISQEIVIAMQPFFKLYADQARGRSLCYGNSSFGVSPATQKLFADELGFQICCNDPNSLNQVFGRLHSMYLNEGNLKGWIRAVDSLINDFKINLKEGDPSIGNQLIVLQSVQESLNRLEQKEKELGYSQLAIKNKKERTQGPPPAVEESPPISKFASSCAREALSGISALSSRAKQLISLTLILGDEAQWPHKIQTRTREAIRSCPKTQVEKLNLVCILQNLGEPHAEKIVDLYFSTGLVFKGFGDFDLNVFQGAVRKYGRTLFYAGGENYDSLYVKTKKNFRDNFANEEGIYLESGNLERGRHQGQAGAAASIREQVFIHELAHRVDAKRKLVAPTGSPAKEFQKISFVQKSGISRPKNFPLRCDQKDHSFWKEQEKGPMPNPLEALAKEMGFVSFYATTNQFEDFAESALACIVGEPSLAQINPQKSAYFQRLFGMACKSSSATKDSVGRQKSSQPPETSDSDKTHDHHQHSPQSSRRAI